MLKFDPKGHLTPYAPILASVNDLENNFVIGINSVTRKQNFDKYVHYSDELKHLLEGKELKQWINGSFVTKKINPEDIDIVTFIDAADVQKLGKKLDGFRPNMSEIKFGIDAYLIEVHPVDSVDYQRFTKSDIAYWLDAFSTIKNQRGHKHPKGFLEIYY